MRFFDYRNKLKLGCKYSGQVCEENLAYNSMKKSSVIGRRFYT